MTMIQFVRNYDDLSTDRGYQFKFHCDKCGNGHMSPFQSSTLGIAGSALRVAGDLFGGLFSSGADSAYEIQRAVGGKAHDSALREAVEQAKKHFHQCTRCGQWVCPEVCWNAKANLCEGCAPDYESEFASAHAQAKADAAREQLHEKARQTNLVGDVDMSARAVVGAPRQATAAADRCGGCGAGIATDARFCAQCGTPRQAPGCPGCGAAVQANTRFCAGCGTKLV